MDFAQRQRSPTRHLTGLTAVVLLHVAIVYALVNGLARKVVEVIQQPLETTIIPEVKVQEQPPAAPQLKLEPPPPAYVPPPEIRIQAPVVENTITAVTPIKPVEPAVPAPAEEPVMPPRFDAAYLNNPPPDYPAAARRRGQEGKVLLRVYIRADGTPERIEIAQSSGYKTLDDAALNAVRRWRFVPAKRGTEAVAAWADVPLTFKLN